MIEAIPYQEHYPASAFPDRLTGSGMVQDNIGYCPGPLQVAPPLF